MQTPSWNITVPLQVTFLRY